MSTDHIEKPQNLEEYRKRTKQRIHEVIYSIMKTKGDETHKNK